uniref:KilA, N-terminal n=1 Tax=Dechloromonas aromatica (strain RCB) TaxID=159087 RepID=Q47HY0_DECAR
MFREDGYINATKAAKAFGKDIREFLKLGSTQDYMEALEKMMVIPLNIQKQSTRGRNGSTFLHPKLGIRLAQWLDVRFAVWCDLMKNVEAPTWRPTYSIQSSAPPYP